MPDYLCSKIYRIHSEANGLTYYGSTTQPLCNRMAEHRHKFKKGGGSSSARVIAGGDAKIYLVQRVEALCKEDLIRIERQHIENNECVNRNIPGRLPRCHHARQRSKCVPCGGGSICEHQKMRNACGQCTARTRCELCKTSYQSLKTYNAHCKSKKHLTNAREHYNKIRENIRQSPPDKADDIVKMFCDMEIQRWLKA